MSNPAITSDFKTEPWWWEAARPTPTRTTRPPSTADVVVVGAGYTGLSSALTLARSGRNVTVIDALMPGEAASSRNAGLVGRALLGGFSKMSARLGLERTAQLTKGAEDAYDYTISLMNELKIECHLTHRGRLIPTWNQQQYDETAADFALQQQHLNIEGGMLSADELSQELRVKGASGALLVANTSTVHPAMYHRGLRAAVEAGGATIVGDCALENLTRTADNIEVMTSRGAIRTNNVVVATNGYTGGVTPWFRRRIVKSTAFMAACEPRDASLLKSLVPGQRPCVDYSRNMFNYWRLAPDDSNRLLFGGQTGYLFKSERDIARLLQVDLARVFPELEGTRFTHLWKGQIGFTMDRLPHLGVRDGIHFAMGCNGAGLPMGTYIGHKIAQRLLGDPQSTTPFDNLPFPKSPCVFGFPWFMPVVTAWARWQDSRGIAAKGH